MREIVVVSGKGGAGKTSVTAAFACLAKNAVLCDFDVDTPDMHILLNPTHRTRQEFWSGLEAQVDYSLCSRCGLCRDMCQFDAIDLSFAPSINLFRCEGCGVCEAFCPEHAVSMAKKHCGEWFLSDTRFGPLVHAQLFPGEENSGLLVNLLKQEARKLANEQGSAIILADGPPGIGCPVISSLRGAHLVLVVTEPTPSGVHDFERVTALCDHFRLPVAVLVNKADLYEPEAQKIINYCEQKAYAYLGSLPYDPFVVETMVAGKVVTEFPESALAAEFYLLWEKLCLLANV